MRHLQYTTAALAGLSVVAVVGLSACSSDESASTETTSAAATTSSAAAAPAPGAPAAPADPAANLVGAGCEAYAKANPEGAGSVAGMATAPVADAAAANPMLQTLTKALSGQLNPGVNLVDTLNSGEYTVFAPTDDAFAKLDPATLEKLKTDADLLGGILKYHVVQGQIPPANIVGTHTTLQGGTVTVTGPAPNLKVDETSSVVCGGVVTKNAQVYMIDTVLSPPAS